MPRPTWLRNLVIKAISLTRRPASPGAHVLVAKHVTDATDDALRAMDDAQLLAYLAKLDPGDPTMPETQKETTTATVDDVLKAMPAEARAAIQALVDNTAATTAEKIAKSLIDQAVQPLTKRAEVAEGELQKARDEIAKLTEASSLTKAVAETEVLFAGVPHDSGPLTSLLRKCDAAEKAALEQIAKAYRALDTSSTEIKKSLGSRGRLELVADSPEAKLDSIAKSIRAATPTLSYEESYERAVTANPDLYTATAARTRSIDAA